MRECGPEREGAEDEHAGDDEPDRRLEGLEDGQDAAPPPPRIPHAQLRGDAQGRGQSEAMEGRMDGKKRWRSLHQSRGDLYETS